MKSDTYILSGDVATIEKALNGAEEIAALRLSEKDRRTLRLLCEEIIASVSNTLDKYNGEFWVESEGRAFEIHLRARADIARDAKASLIDMATTKTNTAPKGILGKLGLMVDNLLSADDIDPALMATIPLGMHGNLMTMADPMGPALTWTMNNYLKATADEKKDDLEGIEKSIIERIADDVVVTARSNRVDIIVQKNFK